MAIAVGASTSTTPGHLTAATMVQAVMSYLQLTGDTAESEALQALNSAIAFINSRKWYKLTGSSDLTMTAADDDIGLPNDFKEPFACYELNSSDERVKRLGFKPLQSLFGERQNNETAGDPRYYAINYKTRELQLSIQPSTTWVARVPQLRLFYYRRLAALTQGSGVLNNEPEFDWYLIWHARKEMAAIREPQKFGLANAEASNVYRELRRGDTDQQTDWSIL